MKSQSVNSGPRHVISVFAELIISFSKRICAQISTSSLIWLEGSLLSPYERQVYCVNVLLVSDSSKASACQNLGTRGYVDRENDDSSVDGRCFFSK